MKQYIKSLPVICASAFCAAIMAGTSAQANPVITGSIGFGAEGVTTDNQNLPTASVFAVTDPFTTVETGSYASVPISSSVSFDGFVFNPPAASVDPLWSFQIGFTVYSFDATTVTSSFNATLDQWDIGGLGIAMITGYTPTDGTWNVNLSQSGASFVFDASSASVNPPPSVPDSGSTMMMLGSGLLVLGVTGRKFCC